MKLLLFIALGAVTALPKGSRVIQDFVAGNAGYIGQLYMESAKTNSNNFLVSPLSVQIIFALANAGAGGNTARQITNSLRLPEGEDKVRETFRHLTESLQNNDQYTLSCANKIYLGTNFNINNSFKNKAVEVFRSEIENIDFGKSQQAAAEMNRWVEDNTHNKIHDLISPNMLSTETAAVMINALYFQGTWVKEFHEIPSYLFRISKDKHVFTDMMTISDEFNCYKSEDLNARFVEFPYKGEDITMTVVLPNRYDGLPTLEARIGEVLVAPEYSLEPVEAIIPKFRIESTIPFVPILQIIGITEAFGPNANFTGIGENKDELYISDVIQKTYIEVDEKGTTAAAATAISFDKIAGGDDTFTFVADHPFLFYLKHKVFGIFLIGRYTTPEEI